MKTFLIICFLTLSGFTSRSVFSQDTEIFIESDKIVPIEEVFDLLKEQTPHTFIYSVDLFDGMPKVSLKKGKTTVGQLLKSSVSKLGYTIEYKKDGTILVFDSGVILNNDFVEQEQVMVSGTVTDPNGMPIPGVNVIEKGTSNGVITNFDGEYAIDVSPDAILIFSYLGYETIEMEVDGQTQINVSLETSTSALEEIVVVGYGTQKKGSQTVASSSVQGDALESVSTANVGNMLQGQVPGLSIKNSSGTPGENPIIRIRGATSLLGGNEALVVVDGLQGGNLGYLSPVDIESITVLKGPSATAIYGSEGANGVILLKFRTL